MLGQKVINRLVLSGPVIPNGQATRLPIQPHGIFFSDNMAIQKTQQLLTLTRLQVFNVASEERIHVNTLATTFWVRAD